MIRKSTLTRIILLLAALVPGLWSASAQEPGQVEAVLRFDHAQRIPVQRALPIRIFEADLHARNAQPDVAHLSDAH